MVGRGPEGGTTGELMRAIIGVLAVVALLASPAVAQQRADPNANVTVTNPAFAKGSGPVVAIDSGHGEFQTIASGYSTFAALLINDGYRVQDFHEPLTAANLAKVQVLVIADAKAPGKPTTPLDEPSAFSDDEIAVLRDWVAAGGALLICADHPPFAGSVRELAGAFGFTISRYGMKIEGWPQAKEIFNRANGGLADGPLTQGLDQIETFYGTSFTAPAGAVPILKLDPRWSFVSTPPTPASDKDWRGASMTVGGGRVVLMAEAGELSAQISAKGGPMGFNAPDATGNRQLVRNIVRWLATGAVAANDP